jgi:hypothetical protein
MADYLYVYSELSTLTSSRYAVYLDKLYFLEDENLKCRHTTPLALADDQLVSLGKFWLQ